jgi:cell division protein FtsQ
MKFPSINISPKVYLIAGAVLVIGLSAYFIANSHYRTVKKVRVAINNEYQNYFIDEKEVSRLVTLNDEDPIVGKYLEDVDLKELEERTKACPYIESVQAFKNHSGVVLIEVNQVNPLARIYHHGDDDRYLLSNGKLITTSPRYTTRSLVVRGDYTYKFSDSTYKQSQEWKDYMAFFKKVNEDKIWSAQVAEIKLASDGSITVFPQIGDYTIYFGKPDELEFKFKKLAVFFKDILPLKGWDAYQVVNVQYKDQIVCD